MKKTITIAIVILAMVSWQCSKDDQRNLSLKESLEVSSAKINTAFNKISTSKGYELISVTDDGAKSDFTEGFRDSIDLKLISGVYEFSPVNELHRNLFFPFRLFKKTGANEKLIVNLPEKLVFHPKHLHFCNLADSALKNNFSINASDYHFYYTWWNNSDYKLAADFTLDGKGIGNLSMFSTWKSGIAGKYSKSFTFPEGYSVTRSGATGDTTKIVFALSQNKDTLLMETLLFIGNNFDKREKQYILSIGDVDIKRSTGIDSIQVYYKGTLQKKAGAKILDNADNNASICYRRDIQLTFDDGTTSKLSELISPSMDTLKSLAKSLVEMNLSKQIVDYIAFSIYYENHH